jgi:RsiW-degrading membrane proteinase PrsW (M82 family)
MREVSVRWSLFWTALVVLSVLIVGFFIVRGGPTAFLISAIAAVLPAPVYGAAILWLDRHEREPARLVIAVFLWGAVVAIAIAGLINLVTLRALSEAFGPERGALLWASLPVPVVEETAKGLALLLLLAFMRREFDNVLDGIVYGALVGLGFAMTENVEYFMRAFNHGGVAALGVNFYVRAVLTGFNHSMYTGMIGLGFGLARETRHPAVRWIAPAGGFCAAIILHGLWNFGVSVPWMLGWKLSVGVRLLVIEPLLVAILVLPGVITLLAIAVLTWRRESRIISEALADETATGAVTEAERAVIRDARARRQRLVRTLASRGIGAWMELRRLYDLQTELAFQKWHAQRGERLPAAEPYASEEALRQRIRASRARLQASEVSTA